MDPPVGVGWEDLENPGAGKALGTGMQGWWVAAVIPQRCSEGQETAWHNGTEGVLWLCLTPDRFLHLSSWEGSQNWRVILPVIYSGLFSLPLFIYNHFQKME